MNLSSQWPAAALLDVLGIDANPTDMGRPIRLAFRAASASQNCWSA